jgi:lambda family phage portal protein
LPTSIGSASASYLPVPISGPAAGLQAMITDAAATIAEANRQRRSGNFYGRPQGAGIANSLSRKLVRMYEAALTTNLNSDFPISLTSSNAEILTSLIGVRSRARTLERNNGYAAGIIWDHMRNVGGHDPFRLEMQVGKYDSSGKFTSEPETNRKIMVAWEKYGRPEFCTVKRNIARREMYWQAIAAVIRDGGVLYRHWGALNWGGYPNNPIGYAIEPLEYDRLDQNWQRPKAQKGNVNEIQFSIEYDDWGGPVAYWILTRHPGDIFAFSNVPKYRDRVPADSVIAAFDIRTRAEQKVGISRMAPIIRLLHQLEQFDIAHITAALTTCCKCIWIEKQFPTSPEAGVWDSINRELMGGEGESLGGEAAGWGSGEGQRYVNTTPGEVNELPWGNKVVMPEAHFPVENAPQFKRDILRAVSSGASVWYNNLAQDMESVNFASGRLGEGAARDMAMMMQEHMIDVLVRPHFEVWLRYWMLSKECDLPFSRLEEFKEAAVFNGRRWAYTNPLQDVQADILTVEAGLDSRSHIISESPRGGNAEEVNREIQADRESDKLHNLDFSAADVTKPTISKGLPGEDKPNPLDAQSQKNPPAASADDEATTKTRGLDLDRFESALETLAKSDPDFVNSGDYASSKGFVDLMRKLRERKKKSV